MGLSSGTTRIPGLDGRFSRRAARPGPPGARRCRAAADVGERFRFAHLAALRVAAAVLAERGRPASARRRLISVWVLLDSVAPELADWAALFAAGAPVRAAIEAGPARGSRPAGRRPVRAAADSSLWSSRRSACSPPPLAS